MTFKKYLETAREYMGNKSKDFYALCLVSDTANLIEKIKYFKNENALLLAEIGDVMFSAFSMMNVMEIGISNTPIDIENMKLHVDTLDKKFVISEVDLLQSIILELGIVSNIVTENMKRDIVEYNDSDKKRLKDSLYSYVLYMLILICKFNFSVDRVIENNIQRLKIKSKEMNIKNIKEGE